MLDSSNRLLYIKKAREAIKQQDNPDIYVCVTPSCKGSDGLQTRFRLATEGGGHLALTGHVVCHIWDTKPV